MCFYKGQRFSFAINKYHTKYKLFVKKRRKTLKALQANHTYILCSMIFHRFYTKTWKVHNGLLWCGNMFSWWVERHRDSAFLVKGLYHVKTKTISIKQTTMVSNWFYTKEQIFWVHGLFKSQNHYRTKIESSQKTIPVKAKPNLGKCFDVC